MESNRGTAVDSHRWAAARRRDEHIPTGSIAIFRRSRRPDSRPFALGARK